MMEKIAGSKIAMILSSVPGVLRQLAEERDSALEKVASLQTEVDDFRQAERIRKVAEAADERGVTDWGVSHEEKVASIHEALDQGKDLAVMEQAVQLVAPDGGFASLSEGGHVKTGSQQSAVALEEFIRFG